MTRVVFLRTKRYPHPSGPKRLRGTVMPIDDDVAAAWAKAGLVELVDAPSSDPVVKPDLLLSLTVPQLRELAQERGVDLNGATKKVDIALAITAALEAAAAGTPPVDPSTAPGDGDAALTD